MPVRSSLRKFSLPKNEQILDACAAPGGKTAHLLESADCHVTALEIDPKRAELIKSTLLRLGVEATVRAADAAMVSEWHSGREFDAILLDAPCTASGIVRRQPDVPWSRRPEDPARLAREQARLLNALWPLVKRGDYSTAPALSSRKKAPIKSVASPPIMATLNLLPSKVPQQV